MSRRRQTGGIDRILEKLERNVQNGSYYEAFQMYNSIYNRLMGERKLADGLRLLESGTLLFLAHGQEDNGTKLSIMLGDHLLTNHTSPSARLNDKLIEIIRKFGKNSDGRQRFIPKVFKWSKMYTEHGDPRIHRACAEMYLLETDYATCCTHCQYLDLDGVEFYSQTLIEVSRYRSLRSELGLIITWAVLQFLTLKRTEHARRVFKLYTSGHPQLTSPFPFQEPLLNFIQFFISAIDKQSPQLVKLLKDKYKKSLERDPCFNECIDKILWVYFKESTSAGPCMGGLGGLMQSLFGPPPADMDTSEATRTVSENTDLD
ncbi:Golgi to ER traffic protein 4 homolog [Bolinopsis microptera]|uniref:Golgi to ER traffic protein 4 homolog n=1 Tax=Bolinopsis microptera TaxID=2820187 RepID=UPI003078A728